MRIPVVASLRQGRAIAVLVVLIVCRLHHV